MSGDRGRRRVDGLSPQEFATIRDLISGYCGISLSSDYRARLQRVLTLRMRESGAQGLSDYLRLLSGTPGVTGELLHLAEAVSNTETYFFREEYQLEALADQILPGVVKKRESQRRLSLWSAGCSSGEEPFTLAMLLHQSPFWHGQLQRWELRVLGTDVNRRMIRRARDGRYRASSFKALEPDRRRALQAAYFTSQGDDFVVKDELRERVSFLHLNLLDRDGVGLFGEMDVILCRNVLMYFPLELRLQVLQAFYRKLSFGGYLLLGHSENLLGMKTPFESVRVRDALVYTKPPRQSGAPRREEWSV